MALKRTKVGHDNTETTEDINCSSSAQEVGVQDFKSMYFFRTAGTGRVLEVPHSSLQRAKELFKSSSSEAPDLPTGADWPVLPLVTPGGLILHFVEEHALLPGMTRGL
ncbi:hypothetical protein WJX75_004951 [Coccomyxa subellipsoidea]|uniref:Uncharacterized protein n=1 Tax=Coccomyxa subellipsoidea TaxID=248742 RepID=A0ABR2Z0M2_9CHLO